MSESMKRSTRVAAVLLAAALAPAGLHAQARLGSYGSASVGLHGEMVSLGDGVPQPALGGGTGVVVERATQLSVPFAVMYPFFGGRWTVDATGAYATGEVELRDVDPTFGKRHYTLDGFTDIRVRATGRLMGDNIVLTVGGSLPSGTTSLDPEQLAALRVLAAPALGLQSPAVGLGPTATAGLVLARQVGGWAWAAGASYELRGEYNPVAAISAGLPEADYDPGDAVHLSLGTEGLVGDHGMTFTAGVDLFSRDELRAGSDAGAALGEVQFGPVYSADWTLRVGTHRFRELTFFVSDRYRTSYERDGASVEGSDGNYLEAGARAVRPLGRRLDLVLGLNLRHHTGLDVDDALATAGTASGGVTVGLSRALGALLVQPYVRGQVGTLDTGGEKVTLSGVAFGVAVGGRF